MNGAFVRHGRHVAGLLMVITVAIGVGGCAANTAGSGVGASSEGTPSPTASVDPGSLVGVWVLPQTFDAPEQPYVSFVQDNTWSSSDGCNTVRGTWTLGTGGGLSTTSGPQTLMGCDGAPLPAAVVGARAVTVTGDALVLVGSGEAGGETALVRSTDPLVGPPGRPVGYWVESNTPTAPFLSFATDQSYSGNDGCNVVAGTWEQTDEGAVTLTPGLSTMMMCDGVDQWLRLAVLARMQAGVMTLQSADGTVLGELTRR